MSAYDDITEGLRKIHDSVYVSGTKRTSSYKSGHTNDGEYPRVKAYLDGGAVPAPWPTTLMGQGLSLVERGRRTLAPTPPPPTSGGSGRGYMRWANGELPSAHLAEYDIICSSGGWSGVNFASVPDNVKVLNYMSTLDLIEAGWHYGVKLSDARANGWVLKSTTGAELHDPRYDSYLADPGNPGYQAKWISNVEALLRQWGSDGLFIDNMLYTYYGLSNGVEAAKYPGPSNAPIPSWTAAITSFAKAVYEHFHPLGFYVAWNAGGYIGGNNDSNSGTTDLALWQIIEPYADGLCTEYWQWHSEIASRQNGRGIRLSGTDSWMKFWDEWQRLPVFMESKGKDFIGMNYSPDTAQAHYSLCSMLLDTVGVSIWAPGGSEGTTNPWLPLYDRLPLGAPQSAKVKNGNRWQRQYANGLVWVDPIAGTAGIQ